MQVAGDTIAVGEHVQFPQPLLGPGQVQRQRGLPGEPPAQLGDLAGIGRLSAAAGGGHHTESGGAGVQRQHQDRTISEQGDITGSGHGDRGAAAERLGYRAGDRDPPPMLRACSCPLCDDQFGDLVGGDVGVRAGRHPHPVGIR